MIKNHPKFDALVNGDPAIMKLLYTKVYPKVVRFVLNNKGSQEDAEEVFQDALYQLIVRAKVKGIELKSTFEGYCLVVCKNLWYQELNKRKKEVRNEGVFELKENNTQELTALLYQDRWDLFEEILQQLTEKCRQLLQAYFNKVPYHTIVEKFSYATENAAFQRVFKCKKQLAQRIQADVRYRDLF